MNSTDRQESTVKMPAFIFLHTATAAYLKEFPQCMRANGGKLRKSKENIYYNALRPVFFVLAICGVFPFFRHGSGVPHCRQYFVIICSATVHSAVTVLTIFTVIIVNEGLEDFQFDLLETLLATQHLVYLIATWPESSYVAKFLEEWVTFQEYFENVTGMDVNLKNIQRKIKIASFLIIVRIFINFFSLSIIYPNIGFGIKCLFSYHALLSLTFLQLWYFSYSAISNVAAQYEKHFIEKCVISTPSESQLEDFRLLWIHMSNIVRHSGNMLAFTMSYFIITSSVLSVYSAFDIVVSILLDVQDGSFEADNLWGALCPFVISSFTLFLFYSSAFCTAVKIAAVNSYLVNMNATRTGFLNEVQMFMKVLRVVPPVCNLRGFTSVDRSSMLSGFGALFTYLIILIQFYISRTNFAFTES